MVTKNKVGKIKRNNIIQLLLSLLIIILFNLISSFIFTRFDLTSEKRYTLSPATKQLLKNLDDIVFFKVYLEGDYPAGFKRLHNETKEMLDEFRAYSDNIHYEFINPSEGNNKKTVNDTYRLLVEKGLQPTSLEVNNNTGTSKQLIFPSALVTYKNNELPLQLLMSQMGAPAEEQLNNSIQSLEYNIANSIRKLSVSFKPKIAFIRGQGELDKFLTADAAFSLSEFYDVEHVRLNGKINSLRFSTDSASGKIINKYNVIIIAKPDSAFDEKDKFIIDQYIMNGGKVFWLIDPVFASQDSLQASNVTFAVAKRLNLDDMLFNYGVRLNYNLIMDLNALPIPVRTADIGGQPQYSFLPWFYFPVLTPFFKHPIVNNLNVIKTEFISSLDTVRLQNVKKTILLSTSDYSRTVSVPARISLETLMQKPDERLYNSKALPVAVLLQGKFVSLYKNRIPPEISGSKAISFKDNSPQTSMIVVADGDIIKNQVRIVNGQQIPYPLGFDRYTRQSFGNKDFILNAVNFLCDDSGLMSVRSRELKIRLLDKTKTDKYKFTLQIINTTSPLLFIIIIGITLNIIRRKKFSKTL
jgi:ABC-2 type transport system permease protein